MSFGIYETVTNRIITELEAGAIPWTQPWKNQKSGGVMPLNRATGRPYSGINIPILWGAASAFGYPTHQWLTFKQARMRRADMNPFRLDSTRPRLRLEDVLYRELRFRILTQTRPEEAPVLMRQAQATADARYRLYEDMASREGTRFHPFWQDKAVARDQAKGEASR